MAKNEGGEAVSCADLRVVQPLPEIGMNLLPSFSMNDSVDRVNVVSYTKSSKFSIFCFRKQFVPEYVVHKVIKFFNSNRYLWKPCQFCIF